MTRTTDVAIIGAGTAGLSALSEVKKQGKRFLVIDPGPYGTTCARVGCMPSKVLIHCANQFHQRNKMASLGILGTDQLRVDTAKVLKHVRTMRDHFTQNVIQSTLALDENLIQGKASFVSQHELEVNGERIRAEKTIIATGTHSFIPKAWQDFASLIINSDILFEQDDLPQTMAVIGAGVIGLEIGQALSRLGIEITQFNGGEFIGGLSDPEINKAAIDIFQQEYSIHLGTRANVDLDNDQLLVSAGDVQLKTPKLFAAMGRAPNHDLLNLSCLGVPLDQHGIPEFDPSTMRIGDTSVFIAGDANTLRPLLHEAADEGRIAGYNAAADHPTCFQRRSPMAVIFTDPNIAVVGARYRELQNHDFVVGQVSFKDQGRSKIIQQNQGQLNIYADAKEGRLLGAEMIAPAGEHIAHLISWGIQQQMTVFDMLRMPFYHPTVEEGMRTALRACGKQIRKPQSMAELALCDSGADRSLE